MTSTAELLMAEQLRQARIQFEAEFRFAPPRRWRADFAIIGEDWLSMTRRPIILVEIDGGGYVAGRHSRGAGIERDCEKTSAAAILGYRVIRVTPKHVDDGRALEWIKAALGLQEAA